MKPHGNRLTMTGATAATYTVASTNNHVSSVTGGIVRTYGYDAAGNATSYASNVYTYNKRGLMSTATVGVSVTNYLYNALGQLIEKSGNGGTILFVYDESGHLLGEYSSAGALIEETLWMSDLPVATLRPSGSTVAIYYAHTDQVDSVRKVTRPSDNGLMWRWDPDAFAGPAANSNPLGLGTFTYNLGYPGQYLLTESSLYYNYFRHYEAAARGHRQLRSLQHRGDDQHRDRRDRPEPAPPTSPMPPRAPQHVTGGVDSRAGQSIPSGARSVGAHSDGSRRPSCTKRHRRTLKLLQSGLKTGPG